MLPQHCYLLWGVGPDNWRTCIDQGMLSLLPFHVFLPGRCLQLCGVNAPLQNFCAGHLQRRLPSVVHSAQSPEMH